MFKKVAQVGSVLIIIENNSIFSIPKSSKNS